VQALGHPLWRQAMSDEFQALIHNKTWHLVPPRAGLNIIDYKWVFKLKQKSDGYIDCFFSRKRRRTARYYIKEEGQLQKKTKEAPMAASNRHT
jgi:hypothetical protein